ncbi:transglycosylase domain-containing protein [Nocardioides sp. KR10-350]|uniref:transglycosylase domain-containing protein n=1 Tax=Nocardioides cheoyonin TaxID=3156615 RepID=UPI0032B5D360
MSDHPTSGRRRTGSSGKRSARSSTQGAGRGAGTRGSASAGTSGKAGRSGKNGKKPLTRKQIAWRIGRWVIAAGLAFVLVLVGLAIAAYKMTDIPNPNRDFQTEATYVYYAGGHQQLGRFAEQNRDSIPYDEMPQTIKDAVVAAENRTFWTDKGIDPKGIIRAAFSNARGNATQGASTITQQYVKILYLNQERSYKRKLKEAILSLKIQRTMSKEKILEGYLNTIYFGRGAYGIQAAAEAYFQKPAKKLTLRQSAVLAAVLNNPYGLDPENGKDAKEALKERYDYVLENMAEDGTAPAARAEHAEKRLPRFPKAKAGDMYGGQRGHALTLVKNELLRLGFTPEQIEGGGLRVKTTFTKKAMNAAEQGVKEAEPDGFSDKNLHVGVASVEPGTGALRGFYGGQDFLKSQINWASSGGMVGSTMKPVTLAAALQAGFSLKDTFDGNSPYEFPDGLTVHNEGEQAGEADGHSYGSHVTATYALEESINTAFVDMSNSIPDGPQKIYKTGLRMGIPPTKADKAYPGIPATSGDYDPDDVLITLGRAGISPINMANTYATIANGGVRSNVHVIDKVTDPDGTVLYRYKQDDNSSRAISEDISDDVSYAMQQVVQSGTGRAALALGRPAAGKTGTATNDKGDVVSAWFVGYTPQLATAVMYTRGNGRGKLDGWLPSYFGADYPADTWTAVMQRDMDGVPVEEFPPPANVDGDAPDDDHEPLPTRTAAPPPPKKTHKPEPEHTHKPHPSAPPTPTPTPTPTQPSPSNPGGSGGCPVLNPNCDEPSETPTSSEPSSTTSSPGGGKTKSPGQNRAPLAWAVRPTYADRPMSPASRSLTDDAA